MNLPSPARLAAFGKAVDDLNKPHRDDRQTHIARLLFEWWWHTGISEESIANRPRWDKCLPHIQAFWMDGAWRVMNYSE